MFTPYLHNGTTRRVLALLCSGLVLVGLSGCGSNAKSSNLDIISQKPAVSGRTPITVLVKNAFSINKFEEAVESKFADIDIVQVGNYTNSIGIEEYKSRLEHDDLTDIVMTWPLDVGEEYWSDRLIDLSGMAFTSRYNLSMLNTISRDGALYYLPGPAQMRGIVYNKTLFEENNWQVPKDYEGFVALCKTIEESGIRAIQLGFKNPEVLDTAFIGYNYANFYSKPQDIQWIADYNSGKGSFGDQFAPALDAFEDMIEAGIWKPEDLEVDYSKREDMLFGRKCAMVEDSVLLARLGYSQAGSQDEFALMPFFNPSDDPDWARIYMVCYIGLSKKLELPENKAKYNKVLELMDYISSPEGQEALSADTGAMLSSLIDTQPPNIPEIEDIKPALAEGRYAVFPEIGAQGALREGLAGMLRGTTTKEQVIEMVDRQNVSPKVAEAYKVLGTATDDFTLLETGNLFTDAMRSYAATDIALYLDNGKDGKTNGLGLCAKLYKGDVTDADIKRLTPDFRGGVTGEFAKVTMTGSSLIETLEHSITVDNSSKGWFYYFSGLKMVFDPAAEPGSRIKSIKTIDGKGIEPDKVYSVAVMNGIVPEKLQLSCEVSDTTVIDMVAQYITDNKTVTPANDGRFVLVN